jgi:DNA invertase Pin-like site-specific DNA recombinase
MEAAMSEIYPIPAVAYYRMSSDKQECSIEDQRAAVAEYAKAHNYVILREYLDEGISGWKSEERKGFQKLIADAPASPILGIIIELDILRALAR